MRLEWGIVSLVLLVASASSYLYLPDFLATQAQVDRLLIQPTLLVMELDITYPENQSYHAKNKGPLLLTESWHITNESGVTHLRYNARSDSMLGILDLPGLRTVDAAALYDKLVYDRVWNLADESRPCAAAKHQVCYELHIRTQRGPETVHERTLHFNEEDLAVDRHREFRIHLDEGRSTQSQWSSLVLFHARHAPLPDYALLVHAFKVFGDGSIQQGIASTRTRVLGQGG